MARRLGGFLLLALCATAALAQAPPSRGETLADLKRRAVVSEDAEDFTYDDEDMLERMKRAESLGGVDLLARNERGLKNLVFEVKEDGGVKLEMTRSGFERYIFLLSQKAIAYFESRNVKAKWAFKIKDFKDRDVFDPQGLLTRSGESLYYRILEKRPARWRLPSGKTMSEGFAAASSKTR